MNPIKLFIEKHNHKKCVKALARIEGTIKYSTTKTCVMYLGTTRGYDELFKMIEENGWYHEVVGDNREGVFLTVKEESLKTPEVK